MAKKKMTRDVPLPSSDGMFGGPGDPKKKYTASDSANYMKDFGVQRKLNAKTKEIVNRKSSNIAKDRKDYATNRQQMDSVGNRLRANPFNETFKSQNSGYSMSAWDKSRANKNRNK